MSKSNSLETSFLALLFNATALANVWDNASASPITSLYVSLHTADPGEGGTQTANECAYGGYARVAVARNSGGWTVSGASVVLASPPATFPTCSSGSETATHFGIGKSVSGAGVLFYSGAVSPNINISNGVAPQVNITVTED